MSRKSHDQHPLRATLPVILVLLFGGLGAIARAITDDSVLPNRLLFVLGVAAISLGGAALAHKRRDGNEARERDEGANS